MSALPLNASQARTRAGKRVLIYLTLRAKQSRELEFSKKILAANFVTAIFKIEQREKITV